MKQLYSAAISLKMRRISQCGKALQSVSDEYSQVYWDKELKIAQFEMMKLKRRANMS